MALTYFHREVYKVGGEARAAGRIAYITRTEQYAPAQARIEHQGLEVGTKRPREDCIEWQARNLPAWAQGNAITFFRQAEIRERAGGVAYTEWRFALPRELTHVQQLDAAHALLDARFGTRHPYVYAVHRPQAGDGHEQPHCHVVWSARTLDGIERPPEQFFKRYNAVHPDRGGAQKAPWTYHKGAVKADRTQYTDIMNAALERAGHAARLHPDRLMDRGIVERTPEPSALPSDSNKARYRGEITPAWQQVLAHRAARQAHIPTEQAQAQQYWQTRKQELGITEGMAPAQQLERITQARTYAVTHPVDRERTAARMQALTEERQRLQREVQALRLTVARLGQEQMLERQRHARTEAPARTTPQRSRVRDLAAELEQDAPHGGLTARLKLHERGREQDGYGHGF
jgi:hypothetical protein